ncbi:hypothetical protein QWZ16_19010 [Vibrio ostreicida]|uniref:TFIIB-type domain-containing protein n=2 Tax=Vibrio ostreicida TaxID=526588 RepID=A0ABT8C027_9VIBR|nr:hypothetical protein [Vibrio ostreicida]MDN3611693.1 hypothetical protein [Vibrio ostreicida]
MKPSIRFTHKNASSGGTMEIKNNSAGQLCCPLCGSEEYLLSDEDSLLCVQCGSFFEDVKQVMTEPDVFATHH